MSRRYRFTTPDGRDGVKAVVDWLNEPQGPPCGLTPEPERRRYVAAGTSLNALAVDFSSISNTIAADRCRTGYTRDNPDLAARYWAVKDEMLSRGMRVVLILYVDPPKPKPQPANDQHDPQPYRPDDAAQVPA
jgi:hypothetical protein